MGLCESAVRKLEARDPPPAPLDEVWASKSGSRNVGDDGLVGSMGLVNCALEDCVCSEPTDFTATVAGYNLKVLKRLESWRLKFMTHVVQN